MALFSNPADAPRPRVMLNKRFSRITVAALLTIVTLILLLWREDGGVAKVLPFLHHENNGPEYYPFETTSDFFPVSVDPKGKSVEDLCATFPKHMLEYVQPVLKMGHGEKRDKIEAQLDSVSACFDKEDLLILSDLDETIRDHNVIDILADLPASYYDEELNPDFRNYVWQKEMRANGTLDTDVEATKRINGWILDKYKFVPMVERAWTTKPNKAFYFFYETDT